MIARSWEDFWFQRVPAVSYAALRVTFGAAGILNLISYTPISMYWPVDAIAPIPGGGVGLRSWIFSAGLSTAAGYVYFAVLMLAFIALMFGFRTRLAVLACFVGTIGQKSWNHLPLTSSVEVITVVLFCLLFVDASGTPSLDAWAAKRRGTPVPEKTQPIWPIRLIRFQLGLLYLNAGLWKLLSPQWRDGTALHYAVNHNIFHRFPFALPGSADWLLTLGTYVTLAWEISFPFMLWTRWTRTFALVTGVFVHLGIWFSMEVGSFSWVTLAMYVAFLPADKIVHWLKSAATTVESTSIPPVTP